jgi:hypothetical protein
MQLLPVTLLPIYLPADKASVPFGDPLEGVTATAAAPGVFTVPGYDQPVNGDGIAFTFLAGGSIAGGIPVATELFVVGASAGVATFNVSLTKGGAAITTTTTGSLMVAHLLSGEFYGVTLPFKPGNSCLVENNSAGTLVLQTTNDLNTTSYGAPQGPNTSNYATLVSLTAGQIALVTINNDWIRVSTAGTLFLQQN